MSELGPSPEQSEIEVQGVALAQGIATLRQAAKTDADFELILQKTQALKELFGVAGAEIGLESAKAIFGQDFIGPEEAKAVFGIEAEEVPAIPFAKEELEKAQELGQMLIFRLPITMAQIHDTLGGKVKDGKKLLYSSIEATGKLKEDCWYKDEPFFKEELPAAGWALVSKEVIPDSTNKDYLNQTETLVSYIRDEVFKDRPLPARYEDAIREFEASKASIVATLSSDESRGAEMLAGLQINQFTRQTPAEALYDLTAYYQTTGERLLPDKYTWTRRRASDGCLVDVGDFDADGALVAWFRPGDRYDALGVSFSRSR